MNTLPLGIISKLPPPKIIAKNVTYYIKNLADNRGVYTTYWNGKKQFLHYLTSKNSLVL